LRVVAEAGNGVEAVAAFERHHPDVTLLDLRMPVMDGVEVVRRESSCSRPTTPTTRSRAR
jgi:CheY-like chemotaxis protein